MMLSKVFMKATYIVSLQSFVFLVKLQSIANNQYIKTIKLKVKYEL